MLPEPGIGAADEDARGGEWHEAGSVTTGESQVLWQLLHAAGRSADALVQQAADQIDGYVKITSPVSGTIYTSAGPGPVQGASEQTADDERGVRAVNRPVANTMVTLYPGPTVSARRVTLVTRALAAVLEVRVRRAWELQVPEMRLHSGAVRGLLSGETDATAEIIGGRLPALATVYRLTGGDLAAEVWRAVLPAVVRDRLVTLVAPVDDDLAVVSLHEPDTDDGKTLRLVAHAAEEYNLLGGVADPVPVGHFAVAWAEAGQARIGATSADRLVPVAGLGDRDLLRILPARQFAAWADDLLRPLTQVQRATLEIWLRTDSATEAAKALGMSRGGMHARLRAIKRTLGADLDRPDVNTALQLALRAPPPVPGARRARAEASISSLLALIPTDVVERWAGEVLAGLDDRLRFTLRVWAEHHGKVKPAAAELGCARSVLDHQLAQVAADLDVSLSSPVVRAELHIAITVIADTLPDSLPPLARHLARSGARHARTRATNGAELPRTSNPED